LLGPTQPAENDETKGTGDDDDDNRGCRGGTVTINPDDCLAKRRSGAAAVSSDNPADAAGKAIIIAQ